MARKAILSNINVSITFASTGTQRIDKNLIKQAAPDGRRLAFEVSEQYPDN